MLKGESNMQKIKKQEFNKEDRRRLELNMFKANLGDSNAMYGVASMHRQGIACKHNFGIAQEYYLKAIQKGNAKAALELAFMYRNGMRRDFDSQKEYLDYINTMPKSAQIERDLNKAMEYFILAYELGYLPTGKSYHPLELAFLCCPREGPNNPYAKHLVDVVRQNLGNDLMATFVYARCLEMGVGIEMDKTKAEMLYSYCDDKGYNYATLCLAWLYFDGEQRGMDQNKAFALFKKLAKQDVADAYAGLGMCYRNGIGTPIDFNNAVKAWEKGATLNSGKCCYHLANCYFEGLLVGVDFKKGVQLLTKGANLNNRHCAKELGECYYIGKGVPMDILASMKCFSLASERGSHEGDEWLESYCLSENLSKDQLDILLDSHPLKLGRTCKTPKTN